MLNTDATPLAYDDMYEALIGCHHGLTAEQSHVVNARLVLLLANQISDLDILREAFSIARTGVVSEDSTATASKQAVSPIAPVHAD
jgi:Protein of unknown function (DUF2783)